ncbi:thiol reductase thioredoxin [Bacillus pseudomycoides]|uniref:Thiol reductase thioredoxin n=1 Tax=Bacillus pseudomycoides TaxID=64104 RepID=A0AA91V924_9BACI|nr:MULTISPECIES: thioredoxin family protein [Bacillus]PEB56545.1 thiol reductase thioredoxin [Bacillus sp. AFS098217]PED80806.1 thiol reductase thioredoxin [Bacillus pseudomycoides]PEU09320.1 thiol reductase thioredoxin [Bacillus sp. AFS019443]PEU16849.1 thiol reductase thioredoxin [Bacillus sp. AFS014408]PFW62800.1 thiol reductase thioredoxin [Bacillus sp. AFS075034]
MKKMLIFGGIIIVLFAAIWAVTNMEDKNKTSNEVKSEAKSEENYYANTISLEDLRKNIADKKDQTIYFYQTDCIHCKKVSPIVVPLAKDLNVDMKVIDIEKEPDVVWDEFKIEGTPTIIHYKEGKEVSRITGDQPKGAFEKWFKETKK